MAVNVLIIHSLLTYFSNIRPKIVNSCYNTVNKLIYRCVMAVNTDLLILLITAHCSEIMTLKQTRGNMSGYSRMVENVEMSTWRGISGSRGNMDKIYSSGSRPYIKVLSPVVFRNLLHTMSGNNNVVTHFLNLHPTSFIWLWHLDTPEIRTEISWKFWNVVLENDGGDQMDR